MSTSFLNLVDDNGTNSTGTLVDKAEFQALLIGTYVTSTSTGAVNNWAPGVDGHTLVTWNGASDATISGLTLGQAGLTVTIRNITTTKVAYFLHQSGLSSAGNKFFNSATSGATPIAAGGFVTYRHDGTNWYLVAHEQGAWITPAYAAGDYTASAGAWTVDAGDVTTYAYCLRGTSLSVNFHFVTTSVSVAALTLNLKVPGGFTNAMTVMSSNLEYNDAAWLSGGVIYITAAATTFALYKKDLGAANWAITTNATYVSGSITLPVT